MDLQDRVESKETSNEKAEFEGFACVKLSRFAGLDQSSEAYFLSHKGEEWAQLCFTQSPCMSKGVNPTRRKNRENLRRNVLSLF